jgi:hypothetical protein
VQPHRRVVVRDLIRELSNVAHLTSMYLDETVGVKAP